MTPKPPDPQDGLPYPRRWWAMGTVGLAIFLTVTDQTMVNVALPTMGADLGIDPAQSVWIVNAYQLAIMLPLLPLASAGEIVGYKRVYTIGLALFTLASAGCAFSTSLPLLILMRVIQGLGAAGVMSVNMALVRHIHPISRLGYGIGVNAVIIAVSAAIGPAIAAAILALLPWPWLFLIKAPFGVASVLIGHWAMPESVRATHKFDAVSAALSAITFGGLIAFIDSLANPGSLMIPAAELLVTIVTGITLCRREMQRPSPLLPVDLLRIPMFALSVGVSFCSFMAQTLSFIALPFHLEAMGYSPAETGLLMTPLPLGTALIAVFSGRLADRYPAGLLGLIGLVLFGAGLAALAFLSHAAGVADIAWRMALAGAGFGFYQSPNNRAIQAAAPRARSGGASGMQAMARLLGQTTGAGLTALVFASYMHGSTPALWLAALCSLLGAGVSAVRLKDMPHR